MDDVKETLGSLRPALGSRGVCGQLVAAPHGLVLIVEEAITIEPAETENLQMLNEFIR